jgi:hypothetical protein
MFGRRPKNTYAAMRKRREAQRREKLRKQAMAAKPNYTRDDFDNVPPPPPPRKDPPRNIDPNTGMRDRRPLVERAAQTISDANLIVRAGRSLGAIPINSKAMGAVGAARAETAKLSVPDMSGVANFPTSYGERAVSTKEDQPARARFRRARRAAGRVSLRIPSLGGF